MRAVASRWVPVACVVALAGCTTAPPVADVQRAPPAAPEVQAAPSDLQRAIERRRRAAQVFEQRRDLVNATRQWSIVLALAPGDAQAMERIAALRAATAQAVRDELAAGRDALRRGETERAQRVFVRVVALDAQNEEAVATLREIDRKQALRIANDRSARAQQAAQAESTRSPMRTNGDAREFDLEQSLELLRAGDANVALAELRRYVAANRNDRTARPRVATALHAHAERLEKRGLQDAAVALYAEALAMHPAPPPDWAPQLAALKKQLASAEYDKGVHLLASDIAAAIVHFEAALRLVPDHTQAQLQLHRARKIQQNLGAIAPSKTTR